MLVLTTFAVILNSIYNMSDFKIVCGGRILALRDVAMLLYIYAPNTVVSVLFGWRHFRPQIRMNVWFPTNNTDREHAVRVVRGG